MQIQQKSFCTILLKFKTADVVIDPTTSFKDSIIAYSLQKSPYLKYEQKENKLEVNSAGEYEVSDIFALSEKIKKEENFVYKFNAERITFGVISFCNDSDLLPSDFFESIDVLILACGGGAFMTPKVADELIQKLSPKICILYGFSEQASGEIGKMLLSYEELKKEIPAAKLLEEKTFKITDEDLERIENTEIYYF